MTSDAIAAQVRDEVATQLGRATVMLMEAQITGRALAMENAANAEKIAALEGMVAELSGHLRRLGVET